MGGKKVTSELIGKIKKLGNETQLKNVEIAGIVGTSDSTVGRILRGYYDMKGTQDTADNKDSPWYKKYKEISNRSVYDVICQLANYELEDEDKK